MKRLLYVLCCCFVLVTAVAACGGNNNAEPPADQNENNEAGGNGAETGEDAAEAEALYQANCLSCHGADLAGGVGPALNEIGAALSADQIRDVIANGKEGTSMPAFAGRLSDEEIDILATWLAGQK
jgi:cytochrome c551